MLSGEIDCYASPERDWDEKYSAELEELFYAFKNCGEALFGTSFHQLGNLSTFIRYVETTSLLYG